MKNLHRDHRDPVNRDTERHRGTQVKIKIDMQINEITQRIIGCAIEVHKNLGPGLLESAYEECLAYDLSMTGLSIKRQQPVPVIYKDVKLECGYRIDILVENYVVVELKALDGINPVHKAQILTYMKFAEKKYGLLINFNVTLLKNGIRRFIL